MAQQDIVQTEASVAERELSLTEARDALDDAGLALLGILDIDDHTPIRPTEVPAQSSRWRTDVGSQRRGGAAQPPGLPAGPAGHRERRHRACWWPTTPATGSWT